MANGLASVGRRDLDTPPPPTTPPEAQPRLAQLAPQGEDQEQGLTLGSLQQQGIILQTASGVEKAILALANLLPEFEQVAAQIIPLLKAGVRAGLSSTAQLPQQGPLQQGTNL